MSEVLRTETLRNGLTVTFHDYTNRYYGNFHRVCIVVRCPVPLTAAIFAGIDDAESRLKRARILFGEEAVYERTLERMGIAGEEVEPTRQSLMENFIRHTFAYLGRTDFAARFVERELSRRGRMIRPEPLHR